jgi:nucleotide-binding universal stress UspA family protein
MMQEILVQLDGGACGAPRLGVALALAKLFSARVTGLFAERESEPAALVARRPGRRLAAAAAASRTDFEAALADSGLAGRWLALAHGEPIFVAAETAFCARFFDLAVVGQGGADYPALPDDLVERVVLESGRPVLVMPQSGIPAAPGDSIVLAWNASREASRALHDSLPLLKRARSVTVLSVPIQESADNRLPQMDILAHLMAHGIAARPERMPADDIGVMDLLLSRAYDLGANLLIMGAPTESRFGKGGGTRFLLRHLTLPVLISG